MKRKLVEKKDESGVYFSVLTIYRACESEDPYNFEIGFKALFTLVHYAESESDANLKIKVENAENIFENEYNELFMVHSQKITSEQIQNIIDLKKKNSSPIPTNEQSLTQLET